MFLQSKYEKQFHQDTRTTFGATGFQNMKREIKTKPFAVGDASNGRLNFERSEQVFPREDVPNKALEAKTQMSQLIDPDILGLRKKEWITSVAVEGNAKEEDFERKLTKIKLGFFDTPLPKYRPNQIEAGTDTRNNYTGWNVSTEAVSKFQNARNITAMTQTCQDKTQRHFSKLKNYQTPVEVIKTFNETMRQTKRDEKELRTTFKEKYRFENPAATDERVNAGVNRLVYEHKKNTIRPQSEEAINANLTFKPNMEKTLKPNLGFFAYHNGSWGKNQASPDAEVWSCCMTEKKTGEGCVKVKVNRDKWILESCGSAYG